MKKQGFNDVVIFATTKHDRDVDILMRFFTMMILLNCVYMVKNTRRKSVVLLPNVVCVI